MGEVMEVVVFVRRKIVVALCFHPLGTIHYAVVMLHLKDVNKKSQSPSATGIVT